MNNQEHNEASIASHLLCFFYESQIPMAIINPSDYTILYFNQAFENSTNRVQIINQQSFIPLFNHLQFVAHLTPQSIDEVFEYVLLHQEAIFYGTFETELASNCYQITIQQFKVDDRIFLKAQLFSVDDYKRNSINSLAQSEYSDDLLTLLKSTINAIPDVICIQNSQHQVIMYNDAGYSFFNHTHQDIVGRHCYDIMGKDSVCDYCATEESFKTKKNAQLTKFIPQLNKWIDARSYPILDDKGEIKLVIEHLRDITPIVDAENAITKAQKNWQQIFQAIKHPATLLNTQLEIVDANDEMLKLSALSYNELIGRDLCEIFVSCPSKTAPNYCSLHDKFQMALDAPIESELQAFGRHFIISCTPIISELTGEKQIIQIATDVSELKRVQKELRLNETKYRFLIENQNDIIIKLNVHHHFTYKNETFQAVFQSLDKELDNSFEHYLHPDSLTPFQLFVDSLKTEPHSGTVQLCMKSYNQWKWFSWSCKAILNKKSEVVMLIAVGHDITEEKKNFQALQLSEARFRSLVTNANAVIFVLDANAVFLISEGLALSKLGLQPGEVVGMSAYDLYRDSPQIIQDIDNALKGNLVHSTIELPSISFDVTYSPNITDSGETVGLVGIAIDITERNSIQKELIEREENWIKLFDKSADPILMLQNECFIDCNLATVAMLGYQSKSDIIGKHPWDISPPTQGNGECSKVWAGKMVETTILNGYNKFEWLHNKADGSPIWVEVMLTTIFQKGDPVFYVVWRDISERKVFEKQILEKNIEIKTQNDELQELNEELIQTNEQLVLAIREAEDSEITAIELTDLISNQNHEILKNSERLERLLRIAQYKPSSQQDFLNYALNEAIELTESKIGYIYYYNEKTKVFTLNSWSKEVMNECRVMNPQTEYRLEDTGCWGDAVRNRAPVVINDFEESAISHHDTPEGHVQLSRFLTVPLIIDDEIVAVIGVANKLDEYVDLDVRQLSLLMDTVWKVVDRERMISELIIAKDKAEESDVLKSTFLANMSHEIRTPMNAIVGFAELMKMGDLDDDTREVYSDIIISRSNDLLHIINDVLDFSKIESGTVVYRAENLDLHKLLDDLFLVYRQKLISIKKNKLQIICEKVMPNGVFNVYVDELKLRQIFTNLLDNAIKFTEFGELKFGYRIDKNQVTCFVADSGIGISPASIKTVFERFRQADNNDTKVYGGTGLGLAICKGNIKLIGGDIWVESEVGKGSTFYFTIPLEYKA